MMRAVHLYLHPDLVKLEGDWHWDAHSDAVYCSDVIAPFPPGFEGTRGIIHPDDVPALRKALRNAEPDAFDLSFRIISTHGTVMPLRGDSVTIAAPDHLPAPLSPEDAWQQQEQQRLEEKAFAHFRLRAQVADLAEKQSGTGSWYYNASTHQTWYSDNVFRLHGLPPQSLNAHLMTFAGYVHPADAPVVEEAFDRAYRSRLPLDITYRIHTPGGQERSLRLCTGWQFDEGGAEVMYALFHDLTGQAALDEQLAGATDRAQAGLEALRSAERLGQMGSWQWNVHTGRWNFSDQYYRLLGLQPKSVEPAAALLLQYVHPDHREQMAEAFRRMEEEHQCPELEYRALRNDGQVRHFQLRGRSVLLPSGELLLFGTVRDLSLQRALEHRETRSRDAVTLREHLLRTAERAGGLATWTWDLQRNKMEWSAGFYELLGYKPNFLELSQKLLSSFLHPDDRTKFNDAVATLRQVRGETDLRLRLLVKDQTRHLHAHLQVLTEEGHELLVAVFRDETALFQQQQEATSRERLLTLLANHQPDKLLVTDGTHTIVRVNELAHKWLQGRGLPATGQNLFEAFPRLKTPGFQELLNAAWKGEATSMPSLLSAEAGARHQLLPVADESGAVRFVLHLFSEAVPPVESAGRLLAETLADAVSERIIVLDRRMNYQVWNRACEVHYGIPREEIIGHNLLETAPGFLDDPGYVDLKKALRGEVVHLTGESDPARPARISLVPVSDEKGGVAAVVWVASDSSGAPQPRGE